MKAIILICMLAYALGHPMQPENVVNKRSVLSDGKVLGGEDHKNIHESIIQRGDDLVSGDLEENREVGHVVKKREAEVDAIPVQDDCSQLAGDAAMKCNEQRAKRDTVSQNSAGQNVNGTANQNDDTQEAWSNEGAYAKQGKGGQFISASDLGGPIVQILQHVYKANCCACGCNCGCPGAEPEPEPESTAPA